MRIRVRAVAASLVVLLVAACGSGDEGTTTVPAPAPTAVADPTTGPTEPSTLPTLREPDATGAPVPEVLDVVAPVVGGGELDLAAFAGQPVALWFWAPT